MYDEGTQSDNGQEKLMEVTYNIGTKGGGGNLQDHLHLMDEKYMELRMNLY